jgi:hypothetical protein
VTDLAAALLAADASEREQLLRSADTAELEAAVQQLGHTPQPAAAEVLALVDVIVDDRSIRKAARRELHRLRSMGIEAPPASASTTNATTQTPRSEGPLEVREAWTTDIDPTGARAVWLVADRPLGGVWFAPLLLNDLRGFQEMRLVDTTRKRFQRDLEESSRAAGIWVTLPGDYALRLVREAADLTRELGSSLPRRYADFRDVFGEAPGPPERALVYETVSPVEASFNPAWLEESPRLFAEREVGGWYVPIPTELRARALEVARTPAGGLLVPGHTPEEQALQLLAETAQKALTPTVKHAFRRRLEETAYIFVQTDRLALARVAVAAARAMEDPNLRAERHPFVRALLVAGLARLTASEQVGTRRAGEVLLDLIERAAREQPSAPMETRPSGLILPR